MLLEGTRHRLKLVKDSRKDCRESTNTDSRCAPGPVPGTFHYYLI